MHYDYEEIIHCNKTVFSTRSPKLTIPQNTQTKVLTTKTSQYQW